ncbi:enoyl-CoA hydratase [Tomitella fengzijianii]|uniref:Enoyl-CoA hydratase n=1 Tax=Tomitella fengzijianii TaxID=2597660 RepID=A0A516X6X0_9ACTN|nr:enoyl-CoA hydratase [Tomitella fengzijianii]QDQ98800.1 enoyl-CoA hydratase [Tomitella fengzijianii]
MTTVQYSVEDAVATITLDRPEKHNAQDQQLLVELDARWRDAAADDAVKVILLRANGDNFSAGHDLKSEADGFAKPGLGAVESGFRWEAEHYLGFSRRWRDVPKPSIAAVKGACVAGALNVIWPCDLIVAADDTWFSDPVVRFGIGGVEYHAHTWEMGARKAKEMLFTAGSVTADEALRLGMVNRVVPVGELDERSLDLARQIARMDSWGLAQAKRAVNQTLDIMGQHSALQAAFEIHWSGHANAMVRTGRPLLSEGPLSAADAGRNGK